MLGGFEPRERVNIPYFAQVILDNGEECIGAVYTDYNCPIKCDANQRVIAPSGIKNTVVLDGDAKMDIYRADNVQVCTLFVRESSMEDAIELHNNCMLVSTFLAVLAFIACLLQNFVLFAFAILCIGAVVWYHTKKDAEIKCVAQARRDRLDKFGDWRARQLYSNYYLK